MPTLLNHLRRHTFPRKSLIKSLTVAGFFTSFFGSELGP